VGYFGWKNEGSVFFTKIGKPISPKNISNSSTKPHGDVFIVSFQMFLCKNFGTIFFFQVETLLWVGNPS
jgi:hypothetical protein